MDDASLKRIKDSPWFVQHKTALRLIALTLLIISMMGAWYFEVVNVPGEYPCSKPFIRLDSNFCGDPTSGFFLLFLFTGGFFQNLGAVLSGTFSGRAREFFMGLSLLPILPFFMTLLFIWKKETPRLRTVNLVAWIVALLITLFIFANLLSQSGGLILYLWGLWLYILVAVGAFTVEILIWKEGARKTNGS